MTTPTFSLLEATPVPLDRARDRAEAAREILEYLVELVVVGLHLRASR
jgi:hypothetical protein